MAAATEPLGDWTVILLNILATVALIAFAASSLLASLKKQKGEKPKLRTRVECLSCGYSVEREYRRGDYVGKSEGRCPKCGGEMIVTAVYEERPRERREEQKLLSLLERRESRSRHTLGGG